MMEAAGFYHFLPRFRGDATHLITFATTVHLREQIHLRAKRLGFYVLRSSSQIEGEWKEQRIKQHKYAFLSSIFPSARISRLCFFRMKDSENDPGDERHLSSDVSSGKSTKRRLWTHALLAANVLIYAFQIVSQGKLLLWGAKVNSLIDNGQLWRLLTSSFLHANIAHLMVNCYSLNSIGPTVEEFSGPRRFLAVYFTSAIASSTMSYWCCKAPAVGASGAIFGLLGSFAVFILRHRKFIGGGEQEIQHLIHVLGINMVIGLLSKGIDNWGHFGGFLGGMAISFLLGPAWRYKSSTSDGKLVFSDEAPLSYFTRKKRTL